MVHLWGDQLGQGRENVRQFLKDNPELTEEIENKVKAEFGLIKPTDQFAEDDGLLRLMPQARRRRKRMLASRKQPKVRQRLPAKRDV